MIVLPNGYKIKIIGSPGAKLLKTMFLDFFDGKECDSSNQSLINLCIFLGNGKDEIEGLDIKHKPRFLFSILSKKDYEFVKSFCIKNDLKFHIASPKKVFLSYAYFKFTIYEYICIALGMSAKALASSSALADIPSLINIDDQLLSTYPDKHFNLRYTQVQNLHFLYEPGTNYKGLRLSMEWMQQQIIEKISKTEFIQAHIVVDLDQIPKEIDIKDYLLPLTILGIYQKSFFILNSAENEALEESEESSKAFEFDYNIYTSLMEVWNSKSYIPQRKTLSTVLEHGYESLRSESFMENLKVFNSKVDFDLAIRRPPIFILDSLDSIKSNIKNLGSNSNSHLILYIGSKENFQKIINLT